MADPAFCPTDDCSVIKRYLPEIGIKLIEGHSTNLKITYPEENRLERAENVKDVEQYISRIDEMIERKEKLLSDR